VPALRFEGRQQRWVRAKALVADYQGVGDTGGPWPFQHCPPRAGVVLPPDGAAEDGMAPAYCDTKR
jgi:hypothetical protein